jgi:Rieske Fe-S protein
MEAPPGSSKKPLWTEEFSVHAADDRYVLRRQFTKFLTLTSFGMLVGNGWIYVKSLLDARTRGAALPHAPIATSAEVPVGGVKLFSYPTAQDHCILVRTADARLVAYSQKCTHLSCAVYYEKAQNRLECPCHQGFFSIADGSVIQGPPQRSLPRVKLEQRGDQLVAIRMEGETA